VSQSIIYAAMPVGALIPMPTFPPMDAMPPPPPNQPVRKKNKGKTKITFNLCDGCELTSGAFRKTLIYVAQPQSQ